MEQSPSGKRASGKKREDKAKILALIATGITPHDAVRGVGRTINWYEAARREDKGWAARVTAARVTGGDDSLPHRDFRAFRQIFFGHDTPPHHYLMIEANERASPGTITMILGWPQCAKGLALDTPLPTPTGWTTMGEVRVGDRLLGDDGAPTAVTATSGINHRPCYRVTFTGGESVICDDEHLWSIRRRTADGFTYRVATAPEMARLKRHEKRALCAVPVVAPLDLPDADLPVDPYVLGAWLGDGTSTAAQFSASAADAPHLRLQLELAGETVTERADRACVRLSAVKPADRCGRGHRVTPGVHCAVCSHLHFRKRMYGEAMPASPYAPLQARLADLGVLGNKHIPQSYLRASEKQRWALLQGLMDTDGTVSKTGACSFSTTRPALRDGMYELLASLGVRCSPPAEERAKLDGRDCGPVWRFCFTARTGEVFRLPRKLARLTPPPGHDRHRWRGICSVEPVEPVPTKCLAVDNATKLYLAGRAMIPTHNSTLLVDLVNWRLGPKDPNWRQCLISEGQDLSRKLLGQIANRMTDEAMFREYIMAFGPFKAPDRDVAKAWNADFLQILRSRNDEKEPSLEARGAGSTLYGGRYDNIDLDDIQSEKTLQLTRKLLTYVRQTVLTRPDRERGRTTFWGSRVGPGDIYEAMLDEGMVDNLVVLPAMTAWVDRDAHFEVSRRKGGEKVYHVNPDCAAKPTWDQGPGTMEFLARMRDKVGEEIWTRTFMQENFSAGAQTFTEEMIEGSKNRERGIGRAANLGVTGILMVDPALESGLCAFASARYDAERFYLTDALERHDIARTEDILDEIDHWATVHRPSVLVVEQNNFQKALVRDTRLDALATRHGFRVEGHQTNRNKLDPVMGVSAMASSFVRGEVSLPWADDVTRSRIGVLVDELRSWRRNVRGRDLKQDLVMALWFGWVHWEAERDTLRYRGSKIRIGGMPFKPTGYGPVMAGAAR